MTLGQVVPKLDALHLMDGIEGLRSLPKHSVDQWYFNGEEVRYFRDVLTSNGESLTSGKFRGEMRMLGSGVGTIDIYTVRDYGHLNSEHHGTLTGIEKYSQEEFDEHTQAGMSGNQPIGNASHN